MLGGAQELEPSWPGRCAETNEAGSDRHAEFFIDVDGRITILSGRSAGSLSDSLDTGIVGNAGFSVIHQEADFAMVVFSPRLITAANFNAIAQVLDWLRPCRVWAICLGQPQSWETFDRPLGALCWIELSLAVQGIIGVSNEHAATLLQVLDSRGYLDMKNGQCPLGRLRLQTGWGANLERARPFGEPSSPRPCKRQRGR